MQEWWEKLNREELEKKLGKIESKIFLLEKEASAMKNLIEFLERKQIYSEREKPKT